MSDQQGKPEKPEKQEKQEKDPQEEAKKKKEKKDKGKGKERAKGAGAPPSPSSSSSSTSSDSSTSTETSSPSEEELARLERPGGRRRGLCVVTGASSGIGRAVAKKLSKHGSPLLLLARGKEKLDELRLPRSRAVACDVTDREAVERAVKEAEAEFGPADLLVASSGCMLLGEVADQEPDEWERMIDTNVKGVLNACRAVLGGMKQRGRGTIVTLSSLAGVKCFSCHAAYCGTKAAVSSISECLREEVAESGVRVVVLCPGAVDTPLFSHNRDESTRRNYEELREKGGFIKPNTVAKCVWFAYNQPRNVCVREIIVSATRQEK